MSNRSELHSSKKSGVRLIAPRRFEDSRGWFTETYNVRTFEQTGISCDFVQDNHSYSALPYTLRGLHFQRPAHGQAKLVRCVRGSIFDVAVDLRADSPTFGRSVSAELSAANGCQLFIPVGFAHGFLTLEPDCEVCYKCSDFYHPESDSGVCWDDPQIGIDWPLPKGVRPQLSPKDSQQPPLTSLDCLFDYNGRPLELLC